MCDLSDLERGQIVCARLSGASVTKTTELFNVSRVTASIHGILAQELSREEGADITRLPSYIAASYVKFVEGAGGRAVPVWIGQDRDYYKNVVQSVNGILLPGGAVQFTAPSGYAAAGAVLYDLAKELNNKGDYFPMWGTCLGFELMTYLAANRREHRANCFSSSQALPLEFLPGFMESRLFGHAPQNIINILATQNITGNYHYYCVTRQNMTYLGLDKDWRIISLNHDENGFEFVSVIEAKNYPFYAVMFHPEKNAYEFKASRHYPHTAEAVLIAQYLANFFINEARKNLHTFSSEQEEQAALIYNYNATYTGMHSVFEQCYFFPQ